MPLKYIILFYFLRHIKMCVCYVGDTVEANSSNDKSLAREPCARHTDKTPIAYDTLESAGNFIPSLILQFQQSLHQVSEIVH